MGWNDFSYKLKGGIIGGIIYLVCLSFYFLKFEFLLFVVALSLVFSFSGLFGCNPKYDSCYFPMTLGILMSFGISILIGVFIGWIIEKFKAR